MKKSGRTEKRKIAETVGCFMLAGTVAALSAAYAVPALTGAAERDGDGSGKPAVVRLWNVDTFEGGKGSRTAFLSRVAARFEKERGDAYVLVSSYTAEGAAAAFAAGDYPELLSFGVGFSAAAEKCLALRGRSFAGGEVGGECRAVPWCRGGYALFCLTDDFSRAESGNTVISVGGSNRPKIAAALTGLTGPTDGTVGGKGGGKGNENGAESGGCAVEESTSAYVRFLSGKYLYLLGTQRDVCRFASRGVNVYCRPTEDFSDLYQYIAVLKNDGETGQVCDEFVDCLLSEENQKRLNEIGMMSLTCDVYGAEDGAADLLESARAKYTLSVFASEEAGRAADAEAENALKSGNTEVLKNFLKAI